MRSVLLSLGLAAGLYLAAGLCLAPTLAASPAKPGSVRAVAFGGWALACGAGGPDATCPDDVLAVGTHGLVGGPIELPTWTARTGPPALDEGPCEGIRLDPAQPPDGAAVQTLGRRAKVLSDDGKRYTRLLGEALGVDSPRLTHLIELDLEGDGVDEVLFVADSHPGAFPMQGPAEIYSFVGVRKEIGGKTRTILFSEHRRQLAEGDHDPMAAQKGSLEGFTDLDGDGRLEIVVGGAYYEGKSWGVVRVADDGSLTWLGSAGCGA